MTLPQINHSRVTPGLGEPLPGLGESRGGVRFRAGVLLLGVALLALALHLVEYRKAPPALVQVPLQGVLEITRPLSLGLARLESTIVHFYKSYLNLVAVNEENARLRRRLAELEPLKTRLAELERENRQLTELLHLRQALNLPAVAANIIGGDAGGLSRTVVVDQGTASHVRPDLAVMVPEGVVGKVIEASSHAARVLLLTDRNSAVDIINQRNRARGIVSGTLDGRLTIKYAHISENFKPGDPVITSGLDGVFPRGLLVGYVSQVRASDTGLFLDVTVRPSVNFSHLDQVLITTQSEPRMPDSAG